VVNPAASNTSISLTTGANPSTYGQVLNFMATVGPQLGIVPTGTVTFFEGSTALGAGTLNGLGQASLTTTAVQGGTRSITAVYAGDTNFAGSASSPIMQTVSRAATSIGVTLTMGANPSLRGQALSFTATISPEFSGTPTGQVTFADGNTIIGIHTPNSIGQAVITTALLDVGQHSVTATYGGDQNFLPNSSVSPLVQTVNPPNGALLNLVFTTTPPITPNTPLFRKPLTLTLTTSPIGIGPVATGTVSFIDGTTLVGTATLSGGVASITAQFPAGGRLITLAYSGDSNYLSTALSGVLFYHSPKPR